MYALNPKALLIRIVALTATLGAYACSDGRTDPIRHPQAEYLVRSGVVPRFTIPVDGKSRHLRAAELAEMQCAGARSRGIALDSLREPALDFAQDAVATGDSGFVLLSSFGNKGLRSYGFSDNRDLFALDAIGLTRVGKPGALAMSSDSQLVVFGGHGTVNVLQIDRKPYVQTAGFNVEGDVFDGCVLDDQIIVHSSIPGTAETLHTYSFDGAYERSFAPVYDTPNPIVAQQLATGHVVCLQQSNTVLLAPYPDVV